MSREFYETRKLFIPYVNYKYPLTYDEWLSLSEDKKAAHLYCQFFSQIVSAWYKAKSFYADEQEGVETVLQYIIKNVPKIEEDYRRFSAPYMYRMSYNCLYCISHDRLRDKWRYENEVSNNQISSDGKEIDLFDFCASYDTYRIEDDETEHELQNWFWRVVESCDKRAKTLAEDLCDGKKVLKTLCKRDNKIVEKIRKNLVVVLPFYYDDPIVDMIINEFNETIVKEVIK